MALLLPTVEGIDRLHISADIHSYSDIPSDEIYVGSMIYYNVTLYNPNNHTIERKFNITIKNSKGDVIHHLIQDTIVYPNQTKSKLPYLDNSKDSNKDYHYISPLEAGTYILQIQVMGNLLVFFENKTISAEVDNNRINRNFHRYKPNSIEFPFPVASLYEKRLKERSIEQFQNSMDLNSKMLDLNSKMLASTNATTILTSKIEIYTQIILVATLIMMVIAAIQLRKRK